MGGYAAAVSRLLSKIRIDPSSGCWIWQGALSRGYGVIKIDGKMLKTHRVMFRHGYGPIRKGFHLDHLCRVKACANPEHLEEVSPRENMMRGESIQALNARKTECDHGHKFSDENTYIDKRGNRACKTCTFERSAQWRKTQKGKAYLRRWYRERKKEKLNGILC